MLHFAIIELQVSEYMENGYTTSTKNHSVEAKDQKEARKKIKDFYSKKSDVYGEHFNVSNINFFEHIE